MLMRMLRRFSTHLREGFKGLWRNKGLALTSILTMSVTLLFVSAIVVLSVNVNHFTDLVKQELSIQVTLDLEISEARAKEVGKELLLFDHVVSSEFSNKENERVRMMDEWVDLKEILEFYKEDNPLNHVVYVKVDHEDNIASVIEKIEDHPQVDDVVFLTEIVNSMLLAFEVVQYIGVALMSALILVTLVVISNTIKITIFSRKQSIEIMRLIGAKKGYIVAPHIVEGVLLGVLGSILPMIATYVGYTTFYENSNGSFLASPFIKFVEPSQFIHLVLLGIFAIGIFISVLGSRRSVRKFMRGK